MAETGSDIKTTLRPSPRHELPSPLLVVARRVHEIGEDYEARRRLNCRRLFFRKDSLLPSSRLALPSICLLLPACLRFPIRVFLSSLSPGSSNLFEEEVYGARQRAWENCPVIY